MSRPRHPRRTEAVELVRAGTLPRDVAAQLYVLESQVRRWCHAASVPVPPLRGRSIPIATALILMQRARAGTAEVRLAAEAGVTPEALRKSFGRVRSIARAVRLIDGD